MNGFFSRLHEALSRGPAALATVVDARGSTPRVAGARLFQSPDGETVGTIGGGVTEARVMELARATLTDGCPRTFQADLHGRPGDVRDGICGGAMRIEIIRLGTDDDAEILRSVAASLRLGRRILLSTSPAEKGPLSLEKTAGSFDEILEPPPRLLIVGAGHIGRSLARLADGLDFAVAVQDERPDWLVAPAFPRDCALDLALEDALAALRAWEGDRFAALVTRGFPQDLEALNALSTMPGLNYVGLLGSRTRVATVLAARRASGDAPFPKAILHAPIGSEIGAETPEEIAVSIAAELIQVRRQRREAATRSRR